MASDDSEAMAVLVARVAQAEADRAALLELLRELEWRVPGVYEGLCPVCSHDGPPHRAGCRLAAALAASRGEKGT